MSVYLLVGRLGSGKSLASVGRAVEYAAQGRRIVANFHLDIQLAALRTGTKLASAFVEVIPARPTAADLESLGRGGPREDEAGLLILDECGTFLNSRQWNDQSRQGLLQWFLHSRKLGWDVIFVVQHASMIDKQIREALCEFLVTVRRLDKMKVPVISWLFPFLRLPKIHIAQVRYGLGPHDPTADHWIFYGSSLYPLYDTSWLSTVDDSVSYCTLPGELARFRYQRTWLQRLKAWWNAPVRVRRPLGSDRRCSPLLALPEAARWQAARRLVERGYL